MLNAEQRKGSPSMAAVMILSGSLPYLSQWSADRMRAKVGDVLVRRTLKKTVM